MIASDDIPDDDQDAPATATPEPADMPSAVNPESQRKRRRRKARIEDELAAFWQRVLDEPIGRRALWGILESGGMTRTTFACGPSGVPQPEATWFHAGARDHAERIYNTWLKQARAGTLKMLDEHHPDFIDPKKARPRP